MSGINAEGAGVPVADVAEVAEVQVEEQGAAAGADGAEVEVLNDGEGEVVPDAEEDVAAEEDEGKGHSLTPEQQSAVDKRIAALTAKRKAAESERDALKSQRDELAERAERLGDAATMRAAEAVGVLPDLVGKADAGRIAQFKESERSVEVFGDWLEDNTDPEDTLDIGGKSYSREQVREFKRAHSKRMKEMADVPATISKLRSDTAEVLRLGMAARKAGWKPGQPTAAAAGGKPKLPVAPAPARTMPTGAGKPRPAGGGSGKTYAADSIKDEDDLARAIESGAFG